MSVDTCLVIGLAATLLIAIVGWLERDLAAMDGRR